MTASEANRSAQREAYGEGLDEVFHRLMSALGLNQAGLAKVIGLSSPMLSQLISAQRVKIGNPAVLHRIQALEEAAEEVRSGRLPEQEIAGRLESIKAATGQWTRTGSGTPGDEAIVDALRGLLRAVASGQELRAATEVLDDTHPQLAEVLRTYGLGSPAQAREHFRRHRDLIQT